MREPNLWEIGELFIWITKGGVGAGIPQKDGATIWFPARPHNGGCFYNRWYCAWLVLMGKADVVEWPGQ